MTKNNFSMLDFFKKYHKWISLIFTLFLLFFSLSGIVLNHRKELANIDLNRNLLPSNYRYSNWNNAAVKGTIKLSNDSILMFGNIGIWKTDYLGQHFKDFNYGFPKGIDNKKINTLFLTENKQLLAGTLFGLYQYKKPAWEKITLPINEERIVDITQKGDSIFILSRSFLLKSNDLKHFTKIVLPQPENYRNKEGLFKTLWVIHSGEIYGHWGRIIVDILAMILSFLVISGLVIFINRLGVKKKKMPVKKKIRKLKGNKRLLKWHNKLGWTMAFFLLITATTGIFLRPPFLIPIANTKVAKIPFSNLESKNPWFDKLRNIYYDSQDKRFILNTSEGFFYSDDNFSSNLKAYPYQPPASIMGVNVFIKKTHYTFLVGSFEGLYLWNCKTGFTYDYIKKEPYTKPTQKARPIGQYLISGYSNDFANNEIYFDYNLGAASLNNQQFISMPAILKNQAISLWNTALEMHTGRIFQSILGDFYILIVPLTGLSLLFIILSGFVVWFKIYKK